MIVESRADTTNFLHQHFPRIQFRLVLNATPLHLQQPDHLSQQGPSGNPNQTESAEAPHEGRQVSQRPRLR